MKVPCAGGRSNFGMKAAGRACRAGRAAAAGPGRKRSTAPSGRVAVLQHVEATFDPLPYDQGAARLYGQICAAVRAAGRQPRKRSSDLQVAATAASNLLPLHTTNPADFQGTQGLVEIVRSLSLSAAWKKTTSHGKERGDGSRRPRSGAVSLASPHSRGLTRRNLLWSGMPRRRGGYCLTSEMACTVIAHRSSARLPA
jgi:hypothetical protein